MPDQGNEKNIADNNESREKRDESSYRFMDQTIKKRPVERKSILFRILWILAAGVAIGLIASLVLTLTQPALRENLLQRHSGKVTIPPDESEAAAQGDAMETVSVNEEDLSGSESDEIVGTQSGDAEETQSFGLSEEEDIAPDTAQSEETEALSVTADQEAEDEAFTEGQNGEESVSSSGHQEEDKQQIAEDDSEGAVGETAEEDLTDAESAAGMAPEEQDPVQEPEGITLKEYRQLYKDMMEVAEVPERALVQVIGITRELDYFNQNYENQRQISGLIAAMTESDLYILTEYRVVDRVERIQVVFCNGTMTDVTFQKADTGTGLAILKAPLDSIGEDTLSELVTAPLGNSYQVSRGEPVLALGSPLGFPGSIAYGIVTSNNTKATVPDAEYPLLTTDIDGSADGSGVLVNLDGDIIGFITSSFGSSTGGITCLGISRLKELIEDLSNNEGRNYVGILGQEVTKDITDRTGIPRGLLVTEVEQDSPAMLGGIKEYDVIVRIGDQSIDNMRNYQKVLQGLEAEETVSVTAMRRGAEGFAEVVFEVTVESR